MPIAAGSGLFPRTQRLGFLAVVATQFLSSVADNALLIIAIELLLHRHAAGWIFPALRVVFYASYLLLAPYAGTIADGWPKSQVILVTNAMKLAGAALLATSLHPLFAFALIGLGASAHSSAKYGILSELLPAKELVMGNAWIEISTVVSILGGIGMASALVNPAFLHMTNFSNDSMAIAAIVSIYFLAVMMAFMIPSIAPKSTRSLPPPQDVLMHFYQSARLLVRDRLSLFCLGFTSLFWAVAAALQFIILRWGIEVMDLSLSRAALLQGAVAIGVILGALASARWISLKRAIKTAPLGAIIGFLVILMAHFTEEKTVVIALLLIGFFSGLSLVPMNALLQARSTILMRSGQTIAIQNFFETLASLSALAIYGGLVLLNISLTSIVTLFGVVVCVVVFGLITISRRNAFDEAG
jgi:LPLT family lysophospholipid transporter-like MFS transporter